MLEAVAKDAVLFLAALLAALALGLEIDFRRRAKRWPFHESAPGGFLAIPQDKGNQMSDPNIAAAWDRVKAEVTAQSERIKTLMAQLVEAHNAAVAAAAAAPATPAPPPVDPAVTALIDEMNALADQLHATANPPADAPAASAASA